MRIAVASGKGGTGKTTLATNLAALLAEKQQVVITDLDVEAPNTGLFIKGRLIREESKHKMVPLWQGNTCERCGQCQEVCNFHAVIQLGNEIMIFPELCHACYACSELCPTSSLPMTNLSVGVLKHYGDKNINFIEGRLDIGQEQAVPLISQTISYVDEHFSKDIPKIFDLPPGTSCPMIEGVKGADYVLLVAEPTPFGLHDLKLTVETMKELGKDCGVVINKYGLGDEDIDTYCRENNIPVLARIPNKRKVAELYSKGKLIYEHIPGLREELEKISSHIFSGVKTGPYE
jgi:MinD superfamily P-loop ATPase